MDEKPISEIVGMLFDSAKTYYQPDLTKMKIGDFDLYASTFFTFVNSFWVDPIIDLNRIERKFRIRIPRYTEDWVDSNTIFNPNTGNFYSFEYFQIALSAVFNLYNDRENGHICSSFSQMFKDEVFALSALFNDLNQTISNLSMEQDKTLEYNGSLDDFKYIRELEMLKHVRYFLHDCKNRDNVPLENYTVFSNMTTKGMFLTMFHDGI